LPEAAFAKKDILSAFCWVSQHDSAILLSIEEEAFAVAHRKNMTQYARVLQ
jgi:hypothetical protein